jgi:hypothetical protein
LIEGVSWELEGKVLERVGRGQSKEFKGMQGIVGKSKNIYRVRNGE